MHLHPAFRSVQFRCQGARSGPLRQRGVVLLLGLPHSGPIPEPRNAACRPAREGRRGHSIAHEARRAASGRWRVVNDLWHVLVLGTVRSEPAPSLVKQLACMQCLCVGTHSILLTFSDREHVTPARRTALPCSQARYTRHRGNLALLTTGCVGQRHPAFVAAYAGAAARSLRSVGLEGLARRA